MSGRYWTTEPSGYLEPRVEGSGAAAEPPRTVAEAFKACVEKHGSNPALHLKRPVMGSPATEWKVWTWQEYWNDCCKFAKTLIALKVDSFHNINILGFNSPEWLIANNGANLASCVSSGIYITSLPPACHYISGHSNAEVLVLEGNKQLAKYCSIPSSALPNLKAIVVYAEDALDETLMQKCSFPVYAWDQFLAMGDDISDEGLEERMAVARPGNCAMLVYTSGTTGPPKAVMISHDNLTWTNKVYTDAFLPGMCSEDRICSFLPMSHVAAQCVDNHIPMYTGAQLYFCQPDALKGSLTVTFKEVKPTLVLAVPRVWEKIMEKVVQVGRQTTGIKKAISTWAKGLGTAHSEMSQYGNHGGAPWFYAIADKLFFHTVKEALGLECARLCFASAAPISLETVKFFAALDIPIYEIFGQSECTGPHTSGTRGDWLFGYCGRPMPGTVTKIVPENKELCYRGRHIFMGYMHMPQETAETIDDEGFLHSGDVAEFDNSSHPDITEGGLTGFMKITGRIKELLITAGGENVPPVLIENEMKALMPAVSNFVVIGDRRKFLTMLVTLKCEMDKESGAPTDKLAPDALFVGKNIGSSAVTVTEALVDPLWKTYIDEGVKLANKKAASNAQNIQKWAFLPMDFSERTGELTPTMKLKRRVVNEKYDALIESLYAAGGDA